MSKVNRIEWVDLLKGVAILWLIVYHMHVFEWMRSPVPVFFFLSGLFFSDGMSFSSFVGKKAKALLVPLAFFFVLGVAASALKCLMRVEAYSFPPLWLFATLIPADADNTNPLGVGAIWFLVSLFEIYIIYYALRRVSKNRWWLLSAAVLLFLISCVALHYYAHGSLFYLFYTFGFCIYFIVAHLLRDKVLHGSVPAWLFSMAIAAYCIRFVQVPDRLLNSGMGGVILMRLKGLVSMSGVIIVAIWLCQQLVSIKHVTSMRTYAFLLFEGRNSLTILGVHMLIMGVAAIILKRFMAAGVIYDIFLFLIIVAFSNLCVILFNRYVPFLVNHKTVKSK